MVVGDSCDQVIHSTAAGGFKVVGDKIVHLIYISAAKEEQGFTKLRYNFTKFIIANIWRAAMRPSPSFSFPFFCFVYFSGFNS